MSAYVGAIVAAVFVLLQLVPQSDAVQCYACDSTREPACDDPFSQSSRINSIDCRPFSSTSNFGPGQFGQPGQPGGQFGQSQFGQPGQPGGQFGQSQFGQPGQQGQPGWGQPNQAGQPGQSGFGSQYGSQGGYCRKVTGKMPGSEGRTYVRRECNLDSGFPSGGSGSSSSGSDNCVSTADGYDCRCYTNLCNGAPSASKSKMALIPLLFVAAFAAFLGRK